MESDVGPARSASADRLTADDAAEHLRAHDEIRARTERHGVSREFAVLQLWSAIARTAYIAVFLFATARNAAELDAYSPMYVILLVVPLSVFDSLLEGARERANVRRTQWAGQVFPVAPIVVCLAGLVILRLYGDGYPWGWDVVFVAAIFAVMAVQPIRQLRRGDLRPASEPWVNRPLTGTARVTTVLIGITTGALVASTGHMTWFAIVTFGLILLLLVMLALHRTPWGLPGTGHEWGPAHWAVFGIVMTTSFGLATILAATDVSTAVSAGLGATLAAVMVGVAFLPTRPAA